MALTNAGRNLIASGLIGANPAGAWYTNASGFLCVGTSATAFAATQTDMQGTSGARHAMDATYPTIVSGNLLTFQSTFGTSEANFDWQEWGVANSSATTGQGTLLNRKQEALGTKTSAQSWQLNVILTVNNP